MLIFIIYKLSKYLNKITQKIYSDLEYDYNINIMIITECAKQNEVDLMHKIMLEWLYKI